MQRLILELNEQGASAKYCKYYAFHRELRQWYAHQKKQTFA
ncbi:hypothetical protein [Vibrio caribbeanicus]|uniref:Uncharacterized protein n=1 Tax=Vibrio caribbeanicus ATCC BAA-2122 TaxID=796620 RepID=E3BIL1_9VIBR|nr:hypothetical protein [Vibrio caribbeanicus]EFP97120.1 hypothetical protein VIBC2010_06769 [Vibrio caribbeanicus ATCC BAA-2122]